MGVLTEIKALFEQGSPHRINALSAATLLGVILLLLLFQESSRSAVKLPFAGVKSTDPLSLFLGRFKYIKDAKGIIAEGYRKYQGKAFQVSTHTATKVIISAKDVEELRNASDSRISLVAASYEFLQGKLLGIDVLAMENPPHAKVCKTQLTQNLAKLIEPIMDECKFAFSKEFPEANDWTPVPINTALLNIVARISGRVFVGPTLCRNEEWLNSSVKFTEDIFANVFTINMFPRFTRRFVSFFLPYVRRVTHHRSIARKYLVPIYIERIADYEAVEAGEKLKIDDMYSWMLWAAKPVARDPGLLADFQLVLSMAAIHTTTQSAMMVLYDLAARPEYIDVLREEMETAIHEDGGVLKKSTLGKMMKLDSFMKESKRVNSDVLSFWRKTLTPITLSDGSKLPVGTTLSAPVAEYSNDPSIVEKPEEFDGYRWYKLRQQEDQSKSHQYVSTGATSLHFGHGNHACPGRFFAANELQILLTILLLKYDFKYPEGEGRPENWQVVESTLQDTSRKLMFKRREERPDFEFLQDYM